MDNRFERPVFHDSSLPVAQKRAGYLDEVSHQLVALHNRMCSHKHKLNLDVGIKATLPGGGEHFLQSPTDMLDRATLAPNTYRQKETLIKKVHLAELSLLQSVYLSMQQHDAEVAEGEGKQLADKRKELAIFYAEACAEALGGTLADYKDYADGYTAAVESVMRKTVDMEFDMRYDFSNEQNSGPSFDWQERSRKREETLGFNER